METLSGPVAILSTTIVPIMGSFAAWLKQHNRRREWNQVDLARKVGASTSTVSRWIAGTVIPDPASCERIADAFLLPLDDVLIAAGHKPPDARYAPDDPRSTVSALAGRVRWTPERQGAVEALLKQWIEYDRQKR